MSSVVCGVCGEECVESVVNCEESHAVCSDCFRGQATEWLSYDGRLQLFVRLEGIKCAMPDCEKVYASTSVELHCSSAVFEDYTAASHMWKSKKSEGKALPENKECTEAKGEVQVAVDFLREQCLGIHCPWCKSAYAMGPEFDECFAMNCTNPTCSCDFCGYCGEGFPKNTQRDFGIDACHRHVMAETCSPFNTGLTPRDKDKAVRHLAFS